MPDVLVQQSWLDHLLRHCETCPRFEGPAADLSAVPSDAVSSTKQNTPEGTNERSRKRSRFQSDLTTDGGGRRKKTPKKEQAVNWFVGQIPSPSAWRKRQLDLKLSKTEDYVQVVQNFFVDDDLGETSSKVIPDGRTSICAVVDRFSVHTANSLQKAELQRCSANFQLLILLSYCRYLEASGVKYDVVDQFIQRITDCRESDRRRLLTAAIWANKLIVRLAGAGLDVFRATELLFLGALSPTYLLEIQSKGNDDVIMGYLRQENFVAHQYDDCLTPNFTIPGLIFDDISRRNNISVSAEDVYMKLGYKKEHMCNSDPYVVRPPLIGNGEPKVACISISKHPNLTYYIEAGVPHLPRDSGMTPDMSANTGPRPHYLRLADIEPAAPQIPLTARSSSLLPPLASMIKTPDTCLDMPYSMEGQAQSLDLPETFNAPILQTMDSAPNLRANPRKIRKVCKARAKCSFQSRNPTGITNEVQGFFSDRYGVSHSPSPPQALSVSENLFHNIRVYFEKSCRNMVFDEHGALLTPNGNQLHNDLCNDFDSHCFTATMLIGKGLRVEFIHALSKACALVEKILRAEHPRTLACFFEVFIHLIQTGLPEVTSCLRQFIKEMSAKVIRKGHPWSQICLLLGELDMESLDQAMAQAWKCTTDIFDGELGTFSRFAISVRLDYIKRMYGITNYLEEESLLRDLMAQLGGGPKLPTPRVMLNLAHNLNRQGRHDEAEEMALEVLSLLREHEMYARRIVERVESLKIVSHCRFSQGKALAAEQTMREAIRMIVDQWGPHHSWVSEFKNVLECWFRRWGREEDANTLRGEIEDLIGKDQVIEQLDEVQGLPG